MVVGEGCDRVPIALAVILLVTSIPAVADETTTHIQDEDELLVGDPTGEAGFRLDVFSSAASAGTYKEYTFPIEHAENRLAIDLVYDVGAITPMGPCLKAHDLDLYGEGPSWQRSYSGCDSGELSVVDEDVPVGDYTVRVEAEQGSTLCVPDPPSSCSGAVEYYLEIHVVRTDV